MSLNQLAPERRGPVGPFFEGEAAEVAMAATTGSYFGGGGSSRPVGRSGGAASASGARLPPRGEAAAAAVDLEGEAGAAAAAGGGGGAKLRWSRYNSCTPWPARLRCQGVRRHWLTLYLSSAHTLPDRQIWRQIPEDLAIKERDLRASESGDSDCRKTGIWPCIRI